MTEQSANDVPDVPQQALERQEQWAQIDRPDKTGQAISPSLGVSAPPPRHSNPSFPRREASETPAAQDDLQLQHHDANLHHRLEPPCQDESEGNLTTSTSTSTSTSRERHPPTPPTTSNSFVAHHHDPRSHPHPDPDQHPDHHGRLHPHLPSLHNLAAPVLKKHSHPSSPHFARYFSSSPTPVVPVQPTSAQAQPSTAVGADTLPSSNTPPSPPPPSATPPPSKTSQLSRRLRDLIQQEKTRQVPSDDSSDQSSGYSSPPPNPLPKSHKPKSLVPFIDAIMAFEKGRKFSTGTSVHRKRQMSTLVEKEGHFGPALTVCYMIYIHQLCQQTYQVALPLLRAFQFPSRVRFL
ncbi:hypothetical protein B0T25DRAFT_290728 [Lasiosphaeria hispida]|uniref:Uncharacterized protein n=1 Tax=Lasiosphaeria hispida TaxID=260671 RepID=A0AAJ0HC80_9PEZI|nr:hypothetical protein B0T25DRAFT_290728 [Lasiosphaeria hispida]